MIRSVTYVHNNQLPCAKSIGDLMQNRVNQFPL